MPIDIYQSSNLDKFSAEEADLYRLINQYRADNGLPPIAASKSLSTVANRHVLDLQENIGSITHGWSDAEYDATDSSTWPAMWEAPQRLNTAYEDFGFENAFYSSAGATAEDAFRSWRESDGHNAVILNQDIWSNSEWNALGVGIYGDYAVMWVGEASDPARAPKGSTRGIKSGSSKRNKLKGTGRDDIIAGLEGNDKIKGKKGDDILGGGEGKDRLIGQAGNDILFGGAGNDTLKGGGGDDILYGGEGSDRLIGNGGSDIFIVEPGNGIDLVKDFVKGTDSLGIIGTTTSSDLSFTQDGANTIVSVSGTQVMTLQNVSGIDQSDVMSL
ncbi:MAG: CAP domain-containing protein [Cyanobacteria bacterium P01_F01_bin.150]